MQPATTGRRDACGPCSRGGSPTYKYLIRWGICTRDLGGHVRRCPEGHVERAFYNSCHQRGCPQCQALATEQWLERQRARLLGCAHHHLIFTIPHELNPLWCWNRVAMANLLFGTVRSVLFELLEDERHLGATPAFISALHTWGRSLALHPHIRSTRSVGRGRKSSC